MRLSCSSLTLPCYYPVFRLPCCALKFFFMRLPLLCPYLIFFYLRLPCCAFIFIFAPAVPQFISAYPAVHIFYFRLPCCAHFIFAYEYPALPSFYFCLPCCALILFPLTLVTGSALPASPGLRHRLEGLISPNLIQRLEGLIADG